MAARAAALEKLPANFHVLGDTPHDWLFPRASLIVHHGGAGTTHAAARMRHEHGTASTVESLLSGAAQRLH